MTILDEHIMHAPVALCFEAAADVERWPEILPHYRFVRFRDRRSFGNGVVEMSAYRDFAGPLRYPTWWLSDMHIDTAEPAVHYRHVDGVTKGMVVKWSFERVVHAGRNATHVRITHAWDGPQWPLIGRFAWEHVISKQFVSFIATRTLAGIARAAERTQQKEEKS